MSTALEEQYKFFLDAITFKMYGVTARPPPYGVSTILVALLFGTNFFLYILFQMIKSRNTKTSDQLTKKEKKELSKPFIGTMECYTALTQELFLTGMIMGMTYVCEYYWLFAHSSKSYSRDLFMFVLIVFFVYAWYTIHPVKDLSLLGREQTEEWKGWMQFIFLLYHYFHAEEVYNSVRVMITCYVWMTGFGNFSFFYMKQDFSWLRLVQMMWRLNFSVLLLMWTHQNTYILYYICPMHTFYFLMVYVTMYCFQSLNATKWGIRWKLLALAIIIYIIWDVNNGLFDILFAWLGTDKVIGANSGSVYEYYFRTSLDHYSTFLGMIFALNYPLAEQFFTKARGWPLVFASILMGAVTLYWLYYYLPLEKFTYNMTHSYMAIIPLTSYIFFRNLTPFLRSYVSMSLHDLGKTTLETYLLQHHIWLSSNAKTLWTLVPNSPWINFALVTIVFFLVSKELYRLTMSLRGMILPDDKDIAWRNMWGSIGIVSLFGLIAYVSASFSPSALQLVVICEGLAIVSVLVIGRFAQSVGEQGIFQQQSQRFLRCMWILFFVTLLGQFAWANHNAAALSADPATLAIASYRGNSPSCISAVSQGRWVNIPCATNSLSVPTNDVVFCEQDMWSWDVHPAECPIAKLSSNRANAIFKGKDIIFVGDSVVRSSYHQFISLLEPKYEQNHSFIFKHQDFEHVISSSNCSIRFVWAPFVTDITKALNERIAAARPHFIVAGASLWDALHKHSAEDFEASIESLAKSMPANLQGVGSSQSQVIKVWLLPTEILDDRLTTPEKRQFMNNEIIRSYRNIALKSEALQRTFHAVLDTTAASTRRESTSTDGVHYAEEIYSVIAQMLANTYSLHFPINYIGKSGISANAKPYQPKVSGAMSNPYYGAGMLVLIVVMLFTMDAWFGIGWFALVVSGQNYDWELAYGPYVRKIQQLQHREAAASNNAFGSGASAVSALGSSGHESQDAGSDKHGELEMLLHQDRDLAESKA